MSTQEFCPNCRNSGIRIVSGWQPGAPGPVFTQHAEICDCVAGHAVAASIAEGIRDVKAGRVTPWEDVKRELGI